MKPFKEVFCNQMANGVDLKNYKIVASADQIMYKKDQLNSDLSLLLWYKSCGWDVKYKLRWEDRMILRFGQSSHFQSIIVGANKCHMCKISSMSTICVMEPACGGHNVLKSKTEQVHSALIDWQYFSKRRKIAESIWNITNRPRPPRLPEEFGKTKTA